MLQAIGLTAPAPALNNFPANQSPAEALPLERATPLRILVADDHPLVREGLSQLIDGVANWQVCGVAADGRELMEVAGRLRPDVIVLDLGMPEFTGAEAVRELKKQLPTTEVVIFSAARTDGILEQLFEAGAKSFIGKNESSDLLKTAITSAAEHQAFLTPLVSQRLLASFVANAPGTPAAAAQVTPREREIIQHIAEGRSNKEIAAALNISSRTAETHRAVILRKLGLSSTADIVRFAVRNGIIEP